MAPRRKRRRRSRLIVQHMHLQQLVLFLCGGLAGIMGIVRLTGGGRGGTLLLGCMA